ncbi:cardiotrophin-2-like [Heptranchias perlo]|uniref:cardiotrophin-2-like n=1 Tax=Heptranchias perlo TaxID=212740 RepID=UPI00355A0607
MSGPVIPVRPSSDPLPPSLSPAILYLTASLYVGGQESAPLGTRRLLGEICDFVQGLQNKTHGLLEAYLFDQGSPFNSSDFSVQQMQLVGLPKAAISYRAWRSMSDEQRLLDNHRAYLTFQEYFQLVQDDQLELGSLKPGLRALLSQVRADLGALEARLASALASLGLPAPPPTVEDPLSWLDSRSSTFQRRLRGYLVCREYQMWLERTERSLSLLRAKYQGAE